MKSKPGFVMLTLAALLAAGNACRAQVGLTVTPPAVGNNYPGAITLNITGLASGQQVRVQTYLDLNGNGVADANEPLADVFTLKDGGATVVSGVTNVSMPFDSNPAPGTITTALSFAPPLENVVGQKIYRVTSNPPGAFTPATATLDVTNAAVGQSVSGVVYSNGIAPLPNAVVVALTVANQNYAGAAVADAAGHYFLTLNPGAYFLLPTLPGFYADQNLAALVVLTNGMSATNDLVVTNGTVAISGSVYDAGNSNALGGVFLQAESDSLFEVAFTDTNGNYTIGACSNNWKIKVTDERLARRGYLAPQGKAATVDTAFGSVSNVNIGLHRGNAIFYGRLTVSNTPVANIAIENNDDQQFLSGRGYTDAGGNYAAAALVDTNVLPAGAAWICSPSSGELVGTFLTNFIFNTSGNVALVATQAYRQDFAGLPVTATISGRLTSVQGNPISGVSVGANATIGGQSYSTAYVNTDTNGNYAFAAAGGYWLVNVNCCGNDGLGNQGYYDPLNFHGVAVPPNNPTVDIVVYPSNLPLLGQAGQVSGSQFNFNLYGANGYNYTVQTSPNLAATNWFTLTVVSNLPGNPFLIQDFSATNSARFYRAFQGP
jgi:hypothetical protein